MSAPLRAISAAFRRRLLAQPGITALPVCPWCGKQVPAKAWGREACQTCESERAEASDYFQAQLDETDWPVLPAPPAEPMFGSDEAGQSFLPDDSATVARDEKKPSPARRAYQRRSSRTGSPYTGRDERRTDRRVVGVVKEDYWTRQQRLAEDAQAHEAAEEWDRNEVAEHAANEPTEGEEGPF